MSDTCGPMYEMPLAQYDRDGRCWKTSEVTSLWALPMSSLTLPTWGSLRDGALYELPMPALPTIERDCSSLPTPTASDKNGPGAHGTGGPDLRTVITTLPTPKAGDGERGRDLPRLRADTHSRELATAVSLLPTPAVNDMGAGKDPQAWDDWTERMKQAHGNGNGHGKSLEQEALRMLPTPRGQDEYERRNYKTMVRIRDQGGDMTLPTWATVVAPSLGDSTSQQLGAGSRSLDDQHQPPLFDAKPATD
jgi:hypothetical protein